MQELAEAHYCSRQEMIRKLIHRAHDRLIKAPAREREKEQENVEKIQEAMLSAYRVAGEQEREQYATDFVDARRRIEQAKLSDADRARFLHIFDQETLGERRERIVAEHAAERAEKEREHAEEVKRLTPAQRREAFKPIANILREIALAEADETWRRRTAAAASKAQADGSGARGPSEGEAPRDRDRKADGSRRSRAR